MSGDMGTGSDILASRAYAFLTETFPGRDFTVFSGNDYRSEVASQLAGMLDAGGMRCVFAAPSSYIPHGDVIIDAGAPSGAVGVINGSGCPVVSLDLPSGVPAVPDSVEPQVEAVRADVTLCFGTPSLSLLFPTYGDYGGSLYLLGNSDAGYGYMDKEAYLAVVSGSDVLSSVRKFAHKGSNGHLYLVCGKKGMAGAAILAASGALRSGCGLVTVRLPESERLAMHISHPSAIVSVAEEDDCSDLGKYSAIGVGCGWGTAMSQVPVLEKLMSCGRPIVLDADALTLLAANPHLAIPKGAVLTPHLGEFRRLAGDWKNDCHLMKLARQYAISHSCVLVLKGAHTMIAGPDGRCVFNSTGTPGMAKGGSGDVLAGMVSGLLARGCDPFTAAVAGVYRHGLAGEAAAARYGVEGMNASDLAQEFPL